MKERDGHFAGTSDHQYCLHPISARSNQTVKQLLLLTRRRKSTDHIVCCERHEQNMHSSAQRHVLALPSPNCLVSCLLAVAVADISSRLSQNGSIITQGIRVCRVSCNRVFPTSSAAAAYVKLWRSSGCIDEGTTKGREAHDTTGCPSVETLNVPSSFPLLKSRLGNRAACPDLRYFSFIDNINACKVTSSEGCGKVKRMLISECGCHSMICSTFKQRWPRTLTFV